MNIAILGTGRIGGALVAGWKRANRRVVFGSRRGSGEVEGVPTMPFAEAVEMSHVVVFAVPGRAVETIVSGLDLEDKTVIDCTNGGDGDAKTTAQMIANAEPSAAVFKAFNTLGFENFRQPIFGGKPADLLYLGNSDKDRPRVETLIREVGLNPVFVGGLDNQGVLDAATRFWFALTNVYGRHVAYQLLSD